MFIAPDVVIGSSMACRVFRGLRLGFIEDFDDSDSTLRFDYRPVKNLDSDIPGASVSKVAWSKLFHVGDHRSYEDPERQAIASD
jgi:hypothetical protein